MIYKVKFGSPEKGWVVLVHGLGEHSGRYGKLIKMLNDSGFGVYTSDGPATERARAKGATRVSMRPWK